MAFVDILDRVFGDRAIAVARRQRRDARNESAKVWKVVEQSLEATALKRARCSLQTSRHDD